jgi:hypothetical protein
MSCLLATRFPLHTFKAAKFISNRIRNATCLALQKEESLAVPALSVLVDAASGGIAAAYEYSPYGEQLRCEGTYAKGNVYRLSS